MSAWTDPTTLKRQYVDQKNLAARADIYAFQRPRVPFPAWVLSHLPPEAFAGPVLDVGCGPGWSVARAAELGIPTIGVDLSPGMLRAASASVPAAGGWAVGDAGRLPIRDGACSAALALHMLYHVPDPGRAVAELRRVVGRSGTVLAVLNGLDHMDTFRSLVATAAGRTDWLPWPSDELNLGHQGLFEQSFARVVLDEMRCQIVLSSIEPIVAYADSAREFYESQIDCSWNDFRSRFAQAAQRHLERDGQIMVTTHSGVFVCTAD